MRKLACLALGVVVVAFESSLFSFLPLEVTKPDIGAPFIIYGIFFLSPLDGLIAAAVLRFHPGAPLCRTCRRGALLKYGPSSLLPVCQKPALHRIEVHLLPRLRGFSALRSLGIPRTLATCQGGNEGYLQRPSLLRSGRNSNRLHLPFHVRSFSNTSSCAILAGCNMHQDPATNRENKYKWCKRILFFALIILFMRLFDLQILKGEEMREAVRAEPCANQEDRRAEGHHIRQERKGCR